MIALPCGPRQEKGPMAFLYKLETRTACRPSRRRSGRRFRTGSQPIKILGGRSLRVAQVRDDDADEPPVLVVEDVAERRLATRPNPP
jgi:hypothetical protein